MNAPVESFHLVTLNATLDLGRLSGKQDLAGWSLQMFVDNLLDEDIHYPDINGLSAKSLPPHRAAGNLWYTYI